MNIFESKGLDCDVLVKLPVEIQRVILMDVIEKDEALVQSIINSIECVSIYTQNNIYCHYRR